VSLRRQIGWLAVAHVRNLACAVVEQCRSRRTASGEYESTDRAGNTGPVRPNTREVDLVRLLGRKNVRRDIWTGPEGDKQPATVLFPGTDSEAWVFWKNDAYKIPADVLIPRRGRSWRTAEGIHIGATLDTLVSLNGKHFRISGFFWDYGGTVRSWEGGQLDRFDPKLTVRLYPTADLATLPDSDIDAISGESAIVFSDTPALQRMNITVVELIVYLEDRWR